MSPHSIDALTHLPNRDALDAVRIDFTSRQPDSEYSVVMIDVDHFKLINDIYGHLGGDTVLQDIAAILLRNLRRTDIMVRYGGDEFLGVLPNTTTQNALNFAQRILEDVARAVFPRGLKVTLSMGIGESRRSDQTLDEAIERADKALYNAKETGRGRISFFKEQPDAPRIESVNFSHFIGRQVELRKLRQLLDETHSGTARFALIQGEAGVGKTRLAQELIRYAEFKGCKTLTGACFMLGETAPYHPITAPLREAFDRLPDPDRDVFLRTIGPVHPATAELFPQIPFRILEESLFFRDDRLKFKIFEDLSRIMHAVCDLAPILFIVDDIQWMSHPDWELFSYLVRGSLQRAIFFVTTQRVAGETPKHLTDKLSNLKTLLPLLTIPLASLNAQEINNLIMFAFRDPNLPQQILDLVNRQSGGNPFFVRELISDLFHQGSISRNQAGEWQFHLSDDIMLPDSLNRLIASRLEILDEKSRKLLRIAALTADIFTLEMLCAVMEENEVGVAEALEKPLKTGIIRESVSADRTPEYRFTHDIVRSYLLREIPESMKAVYHAHIGAYYEAKYEAGVDSYLSHAAYHYCNGNVGRKAREFALRAARHCERMQANRETIRWLESYLTFSIPRDGAAEELLYVFKTLGKLSSIVGQVNEAESYLERAKANTDDPEELARILAAEGSNYQRMSRYPEARERYERAIAGTGNDLRRAEYYCSLAFIDYLEGAFPAAIDHLDDSQRLIARSEPGDLKDSVHATYYVIKGIISMELEPDHQVLELYQQALEIYRRYKDYQGESTVLNNLCGVFSRLGDFENAITTLRQSETIAQRLDDALSLAIVHYNLAETYTDTNQPLLAAEYLTRYEVSNARIHNALGDGYLRFGQGSLAVLQGNLPLAAQHFAEARTIFTDLGSRQLALQSTLQLIKSRLLTQQKEIALHELAEVETNDLHELAANTLGDLVFTRGLASFTMASGCNDPTLARAETLFRQSLDVEPNPPVYESMERRYYLMMTLDRLGRNTEADAICSSACALLEERLQQIRNPRLRRCMLERGIIPSLSARYQSLTGRQL